MRLSLSMLSKLSKPRMAAVLLALLATGPLLRSAQEVPPPNPQDVGPTIAEIQVLGAEGHEEQILQALLLRPGRAFDADDLLRDEEFLWKRLRVRTNQVTIEELERDSVVLRFYVTVLEALRRVVFVGNEEFEREELLLATGLTGGQPIDRDSIPRIVGDLEDHYHREGYRFVAITPEVIEEREQLSLHIEEGPLVRVGDVSFQGNEEFNASNFLGIGTDLSGEIEAGDGWFIFPGTPYRSPMVQRDLMTLEELYRDYGYLDVRAELAAEEFYRDNKRVRLTFRVEEGPRYTVRSVRIAPAVEGDSLLYPEEELLAEIGLVPGQPYDAARIAADEAALRKYYGRRGHPAAVRGETSEVYFRFNPPDGKPEIKFDPETHEVDVVYRIAEGRPMRIRDVIIEGNTQTHDAVIRRHISLEPGDLADSEEAMRSWRRLIGLNYFQDPETRSPFVDYRFLETDREDWVDLRFEVAEGQTGRLLFGGGVNTNTGPFLSVNLQKDNFDIADTPSSLGSAWSEILDGQAFTGGGQSLRLFLAPGLDFSQYSINFTEPDLFGDHIDRYSLNVRLFKTFFFLNTHDENRTGGNFTIGRNFGRFFTLYATPETQEVDIRDLRSGAPVILREIRGSNRFNSLILGMNYDTVEDPFAPIDGGGFGLSHRRSGEFMGGDWDFHQTDVRVDKYFSLFEDSLDRHWVLALEGRARHARETGSLSAVPYSERFFLGGQGSIRGFDFRGVGPRRRGFPLGGEAAWTSTAELRFPLFSSRVRGLVAETEYVRGAFFLDAGSVGDSFSSLGPTRLAAGVGVRVRIPFLPQMPLSLDFGWPLRSEPRDDARVFSFTFGNF